MTNYAIDDIPQKFQKAWHYANGFMASAIKTEDHCKAFVEAAPEWNEEEKEFLLWAWVLIDSGEHLSRSMTGLSPEVKDDPEFDAFISGWFEAEDGAEMFDLYDIKDAQGLAEALFEEYGEDCVGVDMEFEGVFSTGEEATDSDHHTTADALDRLYNIAKAKKKED